MHGHNPASWWVELCPLGMFSPYCIFFKMNSEFSTSDCCFLVIKPFALEGQTQEGWRKSRNHNALVSTKLKTCVHTEEIWHHWLWISEHRCLQLSRWVNCQKQWVVRRTRIHKHGLPMQQDALAWSLLQNTLWCGPTLSWRVLWIHMFPTEMDDNFWDATSQLWSVPQTVAFFF